MLKNIACAGVIALAIIGGKVVLDAVLTDGVPPLRTQAKPKNGFTSTGITDRKEAINEQ